MKKEAVKRAVKEGRVEVVWGDVETDRRVEVRVNHSGSRRTVRVEENN